MLRFVDLQSSGGKRNRYSRAGLILSKPGSETFKDPEPE